MELIADLHIHTLVSTHASATLGEMMGQARKLGLRALAVTDHGVAMPDSPHSWYFHTLLRQPGLIDGDFLLLKGVEANAIRADGALDMEEGYLQALDWVIVSLHRNCIPYMGVEETTALWLHIAENPFVDMIGHAEQRQYPFEFDRVTKAFAANNKVVELNANSPVSRPGNEAETRELMLACKRNGTRIAVCSDAHSIYEVGNWGWAVELLREIDFPEERIINSSLERLADELARHGRPVAQTARELAAAENHQG